MTEITLEKVCGAAQPIFDLVFIHGLTGHAKESWSAGDGAPAVFWPEWVYEEFPGVSIYTLGYPASLFAKWITKELTLFECANVALELLASHGVGRRPLGFIAHSLGGLLTKQILRGSDESQDPAWKAISQHTRLVAFLATPHLGASLAEVLHTALGKVASPSVTALANVIGHLDDLNQSYRNYSMARGVCTLAYYEKYPTKGVLVVPKESADPGVSGTTPIPVEADHISICKPKTKQSSIYRSLRMRVQDAVSGCGATHALPMPFDFDDYTSASESDRRDLLTKLADGGLEHLYKHANEHQNKFAQRYHKLGLHTEERQRSDSLLAEVQQRFTLHVYNEKILKGAQEPEINSAIQTGVIDPICAKFGGGLGPVAVLRALYYLTEQCYIRWDAE